MKKILIAFFVGIFVATIPAVFALSTIFSDVSGEEWYANSALSLNDKDIFQGYDDNTFRGSEYVNRAELSVILDRLLEYERDLDFHCDKLAVFNDYGWYDALNEKYKEYPSSDGPIAPHQNIDPENGEGCLDSPFFVFIPGQHNLGCHEIFMYDIHHDELIRGDFGCVNQFTGMNHEYASFTGFLGSGGACTIYNGKYFYRENKVEVESRNC
jgi:hypothetical protein